MRDLFLPAAAVIIGLAAYGGVCLVGRIERGYRRLGRQAPEPMAAAELESMIPVVSEPRPHPELAAPRRELCAADRYYAENLRLWLAAQPAADVIASNGRDLADYLRQACPTADDLGLGQLVRALCRATPWYRHTDDPYTVLSDALAAAYLDLISLERSTTP